jgi:hypothetical protein
MEEVRDDFNLLARPPMETLDFDKPSRDCDLTTKEAPPIEHVYSALHKAACRSCSFSSDGNLCATGSSDGSVRVFITETRLKFQVFNVPRAYASKDISGTNSRPVIRLLQEHASVSIAEHTNLTLSGCQRCCSTSNKPNSCIMLKGV